MTRDRNGISISTRIKADDGGPVDKEHIEIVSALRDEKTSWQQVYERLRAATRPATIVRIDN
jgi:hypothetical protein